MLMLMRGLGFRLGKVENSVVVRSRVEAKAKEIDQGQRAFFRFQYEISKCGSFGHEIIVRKQFMA